MGFRVTEAIPSEMSDEQSILKARLSELRKRREGLSEEQLNKIDPTKKGSDLLNRIRATEAEKDSVVMNNLRDYPTEVLDELDFSKPRVQDEEFFADLFMDKELYGIGDTGLPKNIEKLSESIDPTAQIIKTRREGSKQKDESEAIADQEDIIMAIELQKEKAKSDILKSDATLVDRLRQFRVRRMGGKGESLLDTLGLDPKSQKSSGKLFQVRDPNTGDIRYVTQEEAYGNLAPLRRRTFDQESQLAEMKSKVRKKEYIDLRKGFRMIENKQTGRYEWVDAVTGSVIGNVFSSSSKINPVAQKKIATIQNRFIKFAEDDIQAEQTLKKFKAAINLNTPAGDSMAEFAIARLANGVGVLTENDLKAFKGNRGSIAQKVKSIAKDLSTGTMSNTQRGYLIQLGEVMIQRHREALEAKADMFNNINKDLVGVDIKRFLVDSTDGTALTPLEYQELKDLEEQEKRGWK